MLFCYIVGMIGLMVTPTTAVKPKYAFNPFN